MRIRIILCNSGGEMDRMTLTLNDEDNPVEVSEAIIDSLPTWTLAPGDIIKIAEVS